MQSFYRNPEFKNITRIFLVSNIILIVFFYFIMQVEISNLKHLYINQNTAVAGKILKKAPNLDKDIVSIFTKGASKEELNLGNNLLKKYGLNENMNLLYIKPFNSYCTHLLIKIIAFIAISFSIFYIIVIIGYRNIFSKVKTISNCAEKIISGNFNIKLEENIEGDFYILNHHFNQMSKKLKRNIEILKEEKLFLKNIISDISHQLKTPLSSLILFNELLANEENIDSKIKKDCIEKSSQQLSRMEWLIINLLKLARLESGAIEFNMVKSPLINTIRNSVSPLIFKAKQKQQIISIQCDNSIILSHDINWTTEAISNILKNSIEHTYFKGNIQINVDESPLCIQINIKDNGEGIKDTELPKIFDRFYKSEASTNPTSIGIGLALTKSIIESQGGSISVDSTVGGGTTFTITFLKSVI